MNRLDSRLEILNLGLSDYETIWSYQKELLQKKTIDTGLPDYLLLVEHPETITVGRKYKGPPIAGAKYIERGGEATLHNPGQMIAYPIVTLRERDLHQYLRKLESVVIDTLHSFELMSDRKESATGVWVESGARKIASIGVAVSHWTAYHGVAINVSNDLAPFKKISPCGFDSSIMTSMEKELGRQVKINSVSNNFAECFRKRIYENLKSDKTSCVLSEVNQERLNVLTGD